MRQQTRDERIELDDIVAANERIREKIRSGSIHVCWPWMGVTNAEGYGRVKFNGEYHLAHRIVWAMFNGELPGDRLVCHTCDFTTCCNPLHLYVGTHSDNLQDAYDRGRRDATGEQNPNATLTEWDVREIRVLASVNGCTQRTIAEKYGVAPSLISMVLNGEYWSHV